MQATTNHVNVSCAGTTAKSKEALSDGCGSMSVDKLHFLLLLAADAQQGEGWETFGPTPVEAWRPESNRPESERVVAAVDCKKQAGVIMPPSQFGRSTKNHGSVSLPQF